MKKARVFFVTILTFILCLFCFAGCGVEGTYKFDSMTLNVAGVETTVKAGEEYMGKKLDAEYLTIELKDDGVAVFAGEEAMDCKWEEKDGKIVFYEEVDGEKAELYSATVDGDTMTITVGEAGFSSTTVLKK